MPAVTALHDRAELPRPAVAHGASRLGARVAGEVGVPNVSLPDRDTRSDHALTTAAGDGVGSRRRRLLGEYGIMVSPEGVSVDVPWAGALACLS